MVDTNWAVDYMHGVQEVVQRFGHLSQEGIGISIISLAELYHGVYRAADQQDAELAVQSFLGEVEGIVPLEEPACRIFAMERVRLRSIGLPIEDLDLLIGAIAIHHGLTLLTNNRRHFGRLPGLNLISV